MSRSATESGFLDDILAHPDDDTPRLIFADWLEMEKRESARADLIRVQVEQGKIGRYDPNCEMCKIRGVSPSRCRCCKLRARSAFIREHELPKGWHGAPENWFVCDSPAPPRWKGEDRHVAWCELRRGWIARVCCPFDGWLSCGESIATAHPVERVRLTDKTPWSGKWSEEDAKDNLFGWWASASVGDGQSNLPTPLLSLMIKDPRAKRVITPEDHRGPGYEHGCVTFSTPEAANDALSDVLLMAARDPSLLREKADPKRGARRKKA